MTARVLTMKDQSVAYCPSNSDQPDTQVLTTCVRRAVARLGLSDGQVAALQGVRQEQWTRQREGRDGHRMHVQRLDRLPDTFLDLLLDELARARGMVLARPAGHLHAIALAMRALGAAVEQLSVVHGQAVLPFDSAEVRHVG